MPTGATRKTVKQVLMTGCRGFDGGVGFTCAQHPVTSLTGNLIASPYSSVGLQENLTGPTVLEDKQKYSRQGMGDEGCNSAVEDLPSMHTQGLESHAQRPKLTVITLYTFANGGNTSLVVDFSSQHDVPEHWDQLARAGNAASHHQRGCRWQTAHRRQPEAQRVGGVWRQAGW